MMLVRLILPHIVAMELTTRIRVVMLGLLAFQMLVLVAVAVLVVLLQVQLMLTLLVVVMAG
jgi:hypothetical protein